MTERRLILLRHGRTVWNHERRFQGHADPPLDDVGRVQAYEVSGILASLRPDLLVSSTAQRARQTAEIVAAACGLPVRTDARLIERGLGAWEGHTLDEVAAAFPREYADWVAGVDIDRTGGESRDDVATRAVAALRDLPVVPLTILVTHGAAAGTLCNALLGIPQRTHPFTGLSNCHWSELKAETRGAETVWRLRGHNLGAPGGVVPLPLHDFDETVSDADA